jgi:hypothetical protein
MPCAPVPKGMVCKTLPVAHRVELVHDAAFARDPDPVGLHDEPLVRFVERTPQQDASGGRRPAADAIRTTVTTTSGRTRRNYCPASAAVPGVAQTA